MAIRAPDGANNVDIESMLSLFVGENDFESHTNQTVKTKKMLKILYECLITWSDVINFHQCSKRK